MQSYKLGKKDAQIAFSFLSDYLEAREVNALLRLGFKRGSVVKGVFVNNRLVAVVVFSASLCFNVLLYLAVREEYRKHRSVWMAVFQSLAVLKSNISAFSYHDFRRMQGGGYKIPYLTFYQKLRRRRQSV